MADRASRRGRLPVAVRGVRARSVRVRRFRTCPACSRPQSSLAEGPIAKAATIVPGDPTRSAAAAHPLLVDPDARREHVHALAEAARGSPGSVRRRRWSRSIARRRPRPVRVAASLSRDAVARERELTAAHQEVVQMLIDERELVLRDYESLLAEVGAGRSLVGPHGSLPEDLQRALLALSARPALSRPLYGLAAGCRDRTHRDSGRATPVSPRLIAATTSAWRRPRVMGDIVKAPRSDVPGAGAPPVRSPHRYTLSAMTASSQTALPDSGAGSARGPQALPDPRGAQPHPEGAGAASAASLTPRRPARAKGHLLRGRTG